jgi:hypothetical protein
VVVMASSIEERDVVETYDQGVNGYIYNPVDFVTFMEVVRDPGLLLHSNVATPDRYPILFERGRGLMAWG